MKRILNFKEFVINENTKISDVEYSYFIVNESINRADLDKIRGMDLKTFLLKTLWNNSVEMFYGKDYKGDPTNDPTIITTGGTPWAIGMSGHGNETAGAVFKDCWDETNDFINRTVELIEKGTISDFWGKFGKVAAWSGIATAIVVGSIYFGLPSVIGTAIGGSAIGSTALGGLTIGSAMASLEAIGLVSAATTTTIATAGLSGFLILSQNDANFNSAYQVLQNKDKFIENIKTSLSNHSDFEADWGLDSWLAGIQGMPGWRKSKLPQSINYDAEKIGWLFLDLIGRATHTFVSIKTVNEVADALLQMGYEIKDNGEAVKTGSGAGQTAISPTTTATQPLKSSIQNPIDYNLLSNFWVNTTKLAQKDSTGNIVKLSNQPDSLTPIIQRFYGIVHNWKMGGYQSVDVAINNIKVAMGKLWSDSYQYQLYDILTNRSGSATTNVGGGGQARVSKPATTTPTNQTAPSGVKGASNIKVDATSTASYNL